MPKGRRRGSRNRGGIYFRTGRGWQVKVDGRDVPLAFENGERMRLKDVGAAELKAARDRALEADANDGPTAPVMTVCQAYLKVKA